MTQPDQRDESSWSRSAVPEEWLGAFEKTRAAEHMDRLEADLALVNELVVTGYAGSLWEKFANALVEYGHEVLITWIRTDLVFGKCAEKGLGIYLTGVPRLRLTDEDIEDVAQETIIRALITFREKVLLTGKWDPKKGASLKTFFVGQCLIRFVSVYRAQVDQMSRQNRVAKNLAANWPLNDFHSHVIDPAITTLERENFAAAVGRIPFEQTKALGLLLAEGYTQSEIAEILGISVGAVESRLYRYRKAHQARDGSTS